ncbi:aspartyl/asparaginyl beta-hydroxylase domain-containing protein [Croceivirga thetidis]|uniref:Aspartyl/asparaginyl beta-hydroxylase domain-containing protein n=1 Tax=Croceivirga thetidis TaxID=2721623 RepID=A0ABX1GTK8_9FLAO|nr:aspartyl/asparaginyl beta-hydroxylase domain-containing protein [Croceivirga thetidis]NKI33292.1 aspartyl/asparaginyl beta-hydroxylase domain-containing protein [Croceivirga thetidis]
MDSIEYLTPDRVLLPFQFDAVKMLDEVKGMNLQDYIYYNVISLRAPAHLVDSSLPIPPPAEDYADGSWTDWMDTRELKQSTYLSEVVDFFKDKTKVTLVRLLRLAPGSVVKEHTDPTLALEEKKSVIRLTIPIQRDEGVSFFLNNQKVPLELGQCWYLRLTDPHRIDNIGSIERINLTIDMIPNDWVKSQIIQY